MDLTRRSLLALGACLCAQGAQAHHQWDWSAQDLVEIRGRIVETWLGKPHMVVALDVGGERWQVELGQPWRHARIGLEAAFLAIGAQVTARGHASVDPADRAVKARTVVIDGREFDLSPRGS